MKILLLRHGLAVDASEVGGKDAARTLSAAGRQQTAETAEAFRLFGISPDKIITSPYPRAAETARITAEGLGCEDAVVEDRRLSSGAAAESYAAVVRSAGEMNSLMLVGHNPDMEEFLAWLIAGEGDARINLGKGSLAVLELEEGGKSLSHRGMGILKALLPAKRLRRLVASRS